MTTNNDIDQILDALEAGYAASVSRLRAALAARSKRRRSSAKRQL